MHHRHRWRHRPQERQPSTALRLSGTRRYGTSRAGEPGRGREVPCVGGVAARNALAWRPLRPRRAGRRAPRPGRAGVARHINHILYVLRVACTVLGHSVVVRPVSIDDTAYELHDDSLLSFLLTYLLTTKQPREAYTLPQTADLRRFV